MNKQDDMDLLIKECERMDIDILSISETCWLYEDGNNIDIRKYLIIHLSRRDRIRRGRIGTFVSFVVVETICF